MTATSACPEIAAIERLVEGSAGADEQQQLLEHVERCSACQQRLERFATEGTTLHELARRMAAVSFDSTAASPPLAEAIRQLKEDARPAKAEPAARGGELPDGFFAPADRPGQLGRLGDYEVQEEVGRGAMGIVFRALDVRLHRVVAIKVMSPQLASYPQARQRFVREGHSAAAVCHENVVAIYAVGEAAGLPYLVMQYVAGKTLEQRLAQSGSLGTAEVLRIGMQAAAGLAAAHAQGLVHRDIKPANLLLENGVERVKLTDFGLARAVDDASLTQSGVIPGTPQFMAPEQARGEQLDARADLFSLGSVLYMLCTGAAPFRGSSTLAVLRGICEAEPREVRELNPDVPPWLAAIIAKLMAKEPAARYASASEVSELLGRCLAHWQQPSSAALPAELGELVDAQRRSAAEERSSPRGGAELRRRIVIAAAALVVFALLVAAASWMLPPRASSLAEKSSAGRADAPARPADEQVRTEEVPAADATAVDATAADATAADPPALDEEASQQQQVDRARKEAQLAELQRIVDVAEERWRIAKIRYEQGVEPLTELVLAEVALNEAKLRYARIAQERSAIVQCLERLVELRQQQYELVQALRRAAVVTQEGVFEAERLLSEARLALLEGQ